MSKNGDFAFGWVIGWFVVFSPVFYYFSHSVVWSLLSANFGVGIAIMILKGWLSK